MIRSSTNNYMKGLNMKLDREQLQITRLDYETRELNLFYDMFEHLDKKSLFATHIGIEDSVLLHKIMETILKRIIDNKEKLKYL